MSARPTLFVVSFALLLGCTAHGGTFTTGGDGSVGDDASTDDGGMSGPVDVVPGSDVVTPPVDAAGDPCAANTDCASCTAGSSCGWCAGRCRTGTSSGPSVGSCGDSTWAWTSSQCSATPPADAGSPVTPACQSCVQSMCGTQLVACLGDSACAACLGNPRAACLDDETFYSLAECTCSTTGSGCVEPCGSLCDRL